MISTAFQIVPVRHPSSPTMLCLGVVGQFGRAMELLLTTIRISDNPSQHRVPNTKRHSSCPSACSEVSPEWSHWDCRWSCSHWWPCRLECCSRMAFSPNDFYGSAASHSATNACRSTHAAISASTSASCCSCYSWCSWCPSSCSCSSSSACPPPSIAAARCYNPSRRASDCGTYESNQQSREYAFLESMESAVLLKVDQDDNSKLLFGRMVDNILWNWSFDSSTKILLDMCINNSA
jgi:hypothetical protein